MKNLTICLYDDLFNIINPLAGNKKKFLNDYKFNI